MIKLKKQPKRYISIAEKTKIMERVNKKEPFQEWGIKYSAFQMQELRNFLMDYLEQQTVKIRKETYDPQQVKSKMVPVQKYFHSEDCIATLDACEKETCLASEPNCFSRKIKGQVDVILEEIFSIS